jgi:hypothetical protein
MLRLSTVGFRRFSLLLCLLPGAFFAQVNVREIDKLCVIPAADQYLKEDPLTITAFTSPRSAGGKHDFFSEGDYWWPDSTHPSGPYIQRDGMTNPDNFVSHRKVLIRMSIQVAALSAAYRITGDKKYALKAIEHLRAWFVNEETKMNPSLLYAQAITRKFTGRGTGIIDTIHLIEVAQSIMILEKDDLISSKDLAAIKKWFADYLKWLTTHQYGIDEMNAKNNHGTCWVMQVAEFAKLVGDQEKMDFCRKRFKEVLLPIQMAKDGSFPLELKRTKPYNYSLFNLDALSIICTILSNEKDNLWKFTLQDGRNMKKGIDFMFPYIADKSKWPYSKDVMYSDYYPVRQPALLFGGLAYNENNFIDLWKKLNAHPENEEIIRNFPVRQPLLWLD